MSMKLTIEINLDESGTYTPAEAAVIAALAKDVSSPAIAELASAPAPAPERRPVGRPKAAEKPAPAPVSAQSGKAAVLDTTLDEPVEEEVEEAPEEAEDDLLGEGEAGTTFTKEDAIAKATKLVSNQKQAVVKAALVAAGAKRVSDLNDSDAIQVFMAALEA